jgi:hypothetical protein
MSCKHKSIGLLDQQVSNSPFVLFQATSFADRKCSLNVDSRIELRNEWETPASDENISTEWLFVVESGYAGDFTRNKSNQSSQDTSDFSASICPRFACPYYKWDRQTYQSPPCIGPGWVSLHRLKYVSLVSIRSKPVTYLELGSIYIADIDNPSSVKHVHKPLKIKMNFLCI